jgi:hypothetical protein
MLPGLPPPPLSPADGQRGTNRRQAGSQQAANSIKCLCALCRCPALIHFPATALPWCSVVLCCCRLGNLQPAWPPEGVLPGRHGQPEPAACGGALPAHGCGGAPLHPPLHPLQGEPSCGMPACRMPACRHGSTHMLAGMGWVCTCKLQPCWEGPGSSHMQLQLTIAACWPAARPAHWHSWPLFKHMHPFCRAPAGALYCHHPPGPTHLLPPSCLNSAALLLPACRSCGPSACTWRRSACCPSCA